MLSVSRNAVLSALVCPHCHNLIQKPTTLFCGHSLCAIHLPLPLSLCPIQDCDSRNKTSTNSSVPPIQPDAPIHLDVTLNKVLALLTKTIEIPDEDLAYPQADSDSEDEQDDSQPFSRRTTLGDSPPLSPRPTTSRIDSSGTDDSLPSHQLSSIADVRPRDDDEQNHVQRDVLPHLPVFGPSFDPEPGYDRINADTDRRHHYPQRRYQSHAELAEAFEKALLQELTCEICFSVFHKPITTPCQHVRTISRSF
jgi:hypothetical protein